MFEQKQKVSSVTFKELTELYDDKVKNNIKAIYFKLYIINFIFADFNIV